MKEGIKPLNNFEAFKETEDSTGEELSSGNIICRKKLEASSELNLNSVVILINQIIDRIECLDKLINKLDGRIDNLDAKLERFDMKFKDSYDKLQDKFEEKIEKVSLDVREANNKFIDVDSKMELKFDKIKNDKRDRISLIISGVTLFVLLLTTFFNF